MRKIPNTLGDIIKNAREKAGITIEALANKVDITERYLYRIENENKSTLAAWHYALYCKCAFLRKYYRCRSPPGFLEFFIFKISRNRRILLCILTL